MTTRFKTAADFRKSLESRLKTMAMEKSENLQRLRRKVAFDRLLARFFSSEEQSFFLKGGYAMELRLKTARTTKDIDLTSLKRLKGERELLSSMILEELRMLAQQDLGDFFVYRLPQKIDRPPEAWEIPYNELAKECALMLSLDEAFSEITKVHSQILEFSYTRDPE